MAVGLLQRGRKASVLLPGSDPLSMPTAARFWAPPVGTWLPSRIIRRHGARRAWPADVARSWRRLNALEKVAPRPCGDRDCRRGGPGLVRWLLRGLAVVPEPRLRSGLPHRAVGQGGGLLRSLHPLRPLRRGEPLVCQEARASHPRDSDGRSRTAGLDARAGLTRGWRRSCCCRRSWA
jgi:hypothetical protein